MILGSFSDMKIFLLILFIVEIGFGEAFLRLSEVSSGKGNFLSNFAMSFVYTFRISLADNDTDPMEEIEQPVTAWILFLLCGLGTNIVMLNLLISIIGQSYERVTSTAVLAMYKEHADLICDNNYLLLAPFSWFRSGKDNGAYLMVVTDITQDSQQSDSQNDAISGSLTKVKEELIELMVRKYLLISF
jgi:hypothetical protein